ncbi:VacJ-like lipoprotein [Candidatus Magnetoovum chiemensis]|nr:VacJ-like lipoprotein [Candidatus Magnetoovum chiemensis]
MYKNKRAIYVLVLFLLLLGSNAGSLSADGEYPNTLASQYSIAMNDKEEKPHLSDNKTNEETLSINDPLEEWNRLMFKFNDVFYSYALKPIGKTYALIGEPPRIAIKHFFSNLLTPIRFVNSLLQFKFKSAGNELLRFGINTTVGIGGLSDYAGDYLRIKKYDTDTGLTLGKWGLGQGFYFVLPVLGPSSLRDGIGLIGDYFLNPITYIEDVGASYSVYAFYFVNNSSLQIGEYEDLKAFSLDPYIALRDAYYQNRQASLKEGQ